MIGAQENNLKNIDVEIPWNLYLCHRSFRIRQEFLVNQILYKRLAKRIKQSQDQTGTAQRYWKDSTSQTRSLQLTSHRSEEHQDPTLLLIQESLIRSGIFFAMTKDAKAKGYNKGRFSFNKKGGRCEACAGDGIIKIEMHFPRCLCTMRSMPRKATTERHWKSNTKGKSIYDVLNITVEEACDFFSNIPSISRKMETHGM